MLAKGGRRVAKARRRPAKPKRGGDHLEPPEVVGLGNPDPTPLTQRRIGDRRLD
jgi:hypothetical protein